MHKYNTICIKTALQESTRFLIENLRSFVKQKIKSDDQISIWHNKESFKQNEKERQLKKKDLNGAVVGIL